MPVKKTLDDAGASREKFGMPSNAPLHNFLLPRLIGLMDEAVATGVGRDVAIAVLIDLVTSPRFDTAAPDPNADSDLHPDYRRDPSLVLVHGVASLGPLPIDAQDNADFVRPMGWTTS
jgi:hypothetical protein